MTFIPAPHTAKPANQDVDSLSGTQPTAPTGDTGGLKEGTHVNWEQRYKDHESYSSRRETEFRKEISGLRANQDTGFSVPKTPEELAAFQSENPEWFSAIETIAGNMANKATQDGASRLAIMEKELLESQVDRAQAQLLSRHPDYLEIGGSTEFQEWIAGKSEDLRQKVYGNSTDAAAASEVFDYFKAERKSPGTKQPQGNAADDVVTGGQPQVSSDAAGPVFSNATIAKMSRNEYEANYEEIKKAQRAGRIIA